MTVVVVVVGVFIFLIVATISDLWAIGHSRTQPLSYNNHHVELERDSHKVLYEGWGEFIAPKGTHSNVQDKCIKPLHLEKPGGLKSDGWGKPLSTLSTYNSGLRPRGPSTKSIYVQRSTRKISSTPGGDLTAPTSPAIPTEGVVFDEFQAQTASNAYGVGKCGPVTG